MRLRQAVSLLALHAWTGLASDAVDLCSQSSSLCDLQSYSGLVPIRHGSLFYWYFAPRAPAESAPAESAPLILWLQGGPGASSMLGLFFELGPVTLDAAGRLQRRPDAETWGSRWPVLFVDSPVGTGWSTAAGKDGYAKDQTAVAGDLAEFLEKFAVLHPEAPKEILITGESYGGHFIPALGAHLLRHPLTYKLRGVAIGDGLTDPETQVLTKPQVAFSFGLIDEKQLAEAQAAAQKAHDLAVAGDFGPAADQREVMEQVVINASAINPYDIRTTESYNWQDQRLEAFFGRNETKLLLHLPTDHCFGTDPEVAEALADDVMRSQKPQVEVLLNAGIPVLLYQGQFDWKDGVVSNEAWARTVAWPGIRGFLDAPREIWRLGGEIAGYWRQFRNLHHVVVLRAGHMVPMNQPLSAVEMIARFLTRRTEALVV